ncbi:hypothetical protein SEA_NYCEIRAE_35 [Gordonia phage Nyceirae]|uniref:Uncharacterized protein n=1 Tax=Gordonia phage Nyceirae TaxID=1887651 RepID=A0A1C9EHZ4_9CAUD|nr:hypothetical protein BIZ68_gp35 [Gordonia phage Nyceirae]AON97398.1 hypothetical protein SEA_NYCEIRAE_35 [Gordonia phage Nyceirae]
MEHRTAVRSRPRVEMAVARMPEQAYSVPCDPSVVGEVVRAGAALGSQFRIPLMPR